VNEEEIQELFRMAFGEGREFVRVFAWGSAQVLATTYIVKRRNDY
jgi:hypothetical protein